MDQDIVVEVAKRTALEIKDQVLSTPFVVVPFALGAVINGLLSSPGVLIIIMIAVAAIVAYYEYQEYIEEVLQAKWEDPQYPRCS